MLHYICQIYQHEQGVGTMKQMLKFISKEKEIPNKTNQPLPQAIYFSGLRMVKTKIGDFGPNSATIPHLE